MNTCAHHTWIQAVEGRADRKIVHDHALRRLADALPAPQTQTPSTALFLGNKLKDKAIHYLCKDSKRGRALSRNDSTLQIRHETSSLSSDSPLYIADANPFLFGTAIEQERPSCHPQTTLSVSWSSLPEASFEDLVLSRLILPFVDVICIFASDCAGYGGVQKVIAKWAALKLPSQEFDEVATRLIIIKPGTDENSSESYQPKLIEGVVGSESLTIEELVLPGTAQQPRISALRRGLQSVLDRVRTERRAKSLMFTATHLEALFRRAFYHFAANAREPFNFIQAARYGMEVEDSVAVHLENGLRLCQRLKVPEDATLEICASSILMDAYPTGMHNFSPAAVFACLYRQHYMHARTRSIPSGDSSTDPDQWCDKLLARLTQLHCQLSRSGMTAAGIHLSTLRHYQMHWAKMRSNSVCLCCLQHEPERSLPCGNTLCERCVKVFGRNVTAGPGASDMWEIIACPICDELLSSTARMKPPTAGVRILSLDGGGVKGIVPLQILALVQELAGPVCPIQELFDLVYGTSIGGILALNLFHRNSTIQRSINMFRLFVQMLFGQQLNSGGRWTASALKVLKCWMQDGMYDANLLQEALISQFGAAKRVFDMACCGVKLGLTACSTKDSSARVFANYNGAGRRKSQTGYRLERPEDPSHEPFVWQAARATSAAPGLFRPVRIPGLGSYEDGGLKYNNPVNIALWESRHIWPSMGVPDTVISLGTGHYDAAPSPTSPKSSVRDMFVFRLWRSFMSSMDGQSVWRDLMNRIGDDERKRYHRLTVALPWPEPSPDDYTCIDDLCEVVRNDRNGKEERRTALISAQISSLYFELDSQPVFDRGLYHCQGMIRSHTTGILVSLLRAPGFEFELHNGPQSFGCLDVRDICQACGRYGKRIQFVIQHPNQQISLCVKWGAGKINDIGAMPQRISWFEDMQQLDCPFGSNRPHRAPISTCLACSQHRTPDRSGKRACAEVPKEGRATKRSRRS